MSDRESGNLKVDLSGQVALVTGASRGLGRAIAIALGACGARVACVARNAEKLNETAETICSAGGTAEPIACDIGEAADVKKTVEDVVDRWERLDILVNNAGLTRDTLVPRMPDEHWDEVIHTNLRGAFLCTRAVCRPMMSARYGRIINMASVSGLMGNPGQANYSASKAGLIGLTRSVARELAARNITVNAIAPGFIDSDMTAALGEKLLAELTTRIPLRRLGRAEEVAQVVLFLASPAAAYITGHVLTIDGGLTA